MAKAFVSRLSRAVLVVWPALFAMAWAAALLAFPALKQQPLGYLPTLVGIALGLVVLHRATLLRIEHVLNGPSPSTYLVRVLAVAALLRCLAVFAFPLQPMADDAQFQRYAAALVAGQGYGAPGYLAWFPPGMSLVLAAWYSLTGVSVLSGKLLHAAIGTVLVWQIAAAGRQLGSERTARLAGALAAVFPTLVFYTATLGYETLLALILLLVVRLASAGMTHNRRIGARDVAVGVLLGVGALVKPICLLVPGVLALAWWLAGLSIRAIIPKVIVAVIAMAAVISPWTIRNYRVLGAFVPVSTNGGYTLYAANHPGASGLATTPAEPLPGETDEVTRDRLRMSAAISWMARNPRELARLAFVKATYTWGTASSIMAVVSTDRLPLTVENLCKGVLNVAWSALFVWFCVAVWRGGARQAGFLPALLVVAYVFVLHLVYEANSRHQVPVVPVLLILGALSCPESLGSRPKDVRQEDNSASTPSL